MSKKALRLAWPEAKKLCRLSHDDIIMAKRLGFQPDSLIRARPSPKPQWKLPVLEWIRELHLERFGYVLGQKPSAVTQPEVPEVDADAAPNF